MKQFKTCAELEESVGHVLGKYGSDTLKAILHLRKRERLHGWRKNAMSEGESRDSVLKFWNYSHYKPSIISDCE